MASLKPALITGRVSHASGAVVPRDPLSIGWTYGPRFINVDGHPAYARAITELRSSGALSRCCYCQPSPYLNNIIEQDHRFIKKRIAASLGFRSVEGAFAND